MKAMAAPAGHCSNCGARNPATRVIIPLPPPTIFAADGLAVILKPQRPCVLFAVLAVRTADDAVYVLRGVPKKEVE